MIICIDPEFFCHNNKICFDISGEIFTKIQAPSIKETCIELIQLLQKEESVIIYINAMSYGVGVIDTLEKYTKYKIIPVFPRKLVKIKTR